MPKHHDLGYGPFTPDKSKAFHTILRMQINIARAVIRKYARYTPLPYTYIDLTAGPGYSDPQHTIPGSPLIFLRLATQEIPIGTSTEKNMPPVPFEAHLFEKDPEFATNLQKETAPYKQSPHCRTLTIHNADYTDPASGACTLWRTPQKYRYGLIYIDPSGDIPNFETLACLAHKMPRAEILLHIPAVTIKRRSRAYNISERLTDLMGKIPKKHWLIRDTRRGDKHQWTFLMGTNADDLFRDLKNENFYSINSKEGKQILERLNYTRQELRELRQPRLF